MAEYNFAPIILDAINNSINRKQQMNMFGQQLDFDKTKLNSEEDRFGQQFGLDSKQYDLEGKKFDWTKEANLRDFNANFIDAPKGYEKYGNKMPYSFLQSILNNESNERSSGKGSALQMYILKMQMGLLERLGNTGFNFGTLPTPPTNGGQPVAPTTTNTDNNVLKDWNTFKFGGF